MSKELEDRFFNFAKNVRDFCRQIKQDAINIVYIRQLIRSSSSIGANYLEASDDLGKADERMKIKISRREAKESIFWLKLILVENNPTLDSLQKTLLDECDQIRKIFSYLNQAQLIKYYSIYRILHVLNLVPCILYLVSCFFNLLS